MADQGDEHHHQAWASPSISDDPGHDESPPQSPSFAPVGRPLIRKRFRAKVPDPLRLDIPHMDRLTSLQNAYYSVSLQGQSACVLDTANPSRRRKS